MRVLLVLAAMPELDPSHAWVRYPVMTPPLTLTLLGAICKRAGHDVTLLDTRLHMRRGAGGWEVDWDAVLHAARASGAELAGVSFLSSSERDGLKAAQLLRELGLTVVGGGLHVRVSAPAYTKEGPFHYVYVGEAEVSFPALLADLESGKRERDPARPQLVVAPTVQDLAIVPAIVDLSYYEEVFAQYRERAASIGEPAMLSVYVETSRGCFKECRFCEISLSGAGFSKFRVIPVGTVMQTVDLAIERHGATYILVADSVATLVKKHFIEFMSEMRRRHPGVVVQFNSTVDRWDEEMAAACAGMDAHVYFGFETASPRMLEIIKKGTTPAQASSAARACERHGLRCTFNVLLGVPGETQVDDDETYRFLLDHPNVLPNPNIFNPLPGTSLHEECLANGTLFDASDLTIWTASRIEREGRGPLRGIDYSRVLRQRERLMVLLHGRSEQLTTTAK